MRPLIAVAIAALTILASAHGVTADDVIRIGVIDLTSENVNTGELRILSDRLRAELFSTGEFTVLERERMDLILREQGFQQSGCVAYECVVEIGQLLGMEKIVAGNVGKVGNVYTLSLRMVDVETGALERTALRDCECALQDILTSIIGQVAAELAGISWPAPTTFARPLERDEGTGILFVESVPSGGRISVDGGPSRDSTPAMLRDVPAGEHVVRVVREHLVAEERVRVVRDDLVKVHLSLGPESGALFIESNPPGAWISIDGAPHGTTPSLLRGIAAGSHTVSVGAEGHMRWEEQIVVELNQRTDLPVTLQPAGYLAISVDTPGATVTVDGRRVVRSQWRRFPLAVGEHRVAVARPDCVPVARDVVVMQGETNVVNARLDFTNEYLRRIEIAATQRRAAIKRRIQWVSLGAAAGAAVVAASFAYRFNSDAQSAYDDAAGANRNYSAATTTADAVLWRNEIDAARERANSAVRKRNTAYGLSGVLLSVGVTLWAF